MAKTDTEENVPWTTSDIFGWVFTVISFAIAVSALVIAVLVYQRDEFSPNIVIDSLVATIGSITGLFTASSIVSTTLVVGAAVPVPPAVRSLHASQVLSFPLKVDEAGRTLIRNLTVTNFECTGSGCPSGSVPIPPPLTSISVAGSFPISTGAVPQAVTTFSKGDSGARVTLSEVYSPDASKLVLRGMTGVDLQASNVTVASVSSTGLAVTGSITATSSITSTGVISAGNITLGTKPLTGSATAVCGNGILEPGEQCDSTPQSVFCDENCHYGQVFPYYQDATTTAFVTSTFDNWFSGTASTSFTSIGPVDAVANIVPLREFGDTLYFDTSVTGMVTNGGIKTAFNTTAVVTRLTFRFGVGYTTAVPAAVGSMEFTCAIYDGATAVSMNIVQSTFSSGSITTFNLDTFVTSNSDSQKTYIPRCTATYTASTAGPLVVKPTSYSASATIIDF